MAKIDKNTYDIYSARQFRRDIANKIKHSKLSKGSQVNKPIFLIEIKSLILLFTKFFSINLN